MKRKYIIGLLAAGCMTLPARSQQFNYECSEPISVKGEVNTYAEENYPLFGPGSEFYFVRTFHDKNIGGVLGGQDIWRSTTTLQWGTLAGSTNQIGLVNDKENNAIVGFSSDGNKVFLLNTYTEKGVTQPGFSYAVRTEGDWGKPQSMGVPAFAIAGDYYSAHVCEDGNVIFVSMAGGMNAAGNHDLFVLYKSENGWQGPVNLGTVLNTTGEEISPFYHAATGLLFFSSDSRPDAMGQDIYYTSRLDETWTQWSEPVRLPGKLNSAKFDAYFTCNNDSLCAFASSRNTPLSDIFVTTLRKSDLKNNSAGNGNGSDSRIDTITLVQVDTVYINNGTVTEEPISNMQTVYFGLSSKIALEANVMTIDSIAQKLKADTKTKVLLSGHTCNRGKDEYNVELSAERAQNIKDELVKKGIEANRIIVTSFGSSQPVRPNDSEENRKWNRRVEVYYFK